MPKVSIITTVFDRVACLRRCIRSVQRSEYPDLEQIIVSDHPPQALASEIAATAMEAGLAYIDLPVRTNDWGHSPASEGLRASSGDYVCFLSDDNAYLPGHFGPLVAALETDPGVGFAYSSCQYAGRRELRAAPPAGARIDLGQPLFRRSVLRDVLGDELPGRGSFAWDWELIHALMVNGVKWKHVDAATFIFRLAAYPQLVRALA